jgi:hypothetical protein
MKQNGAGYVLIYSILSCPILSANPCPNAFPVLCHYDISHLPVPPGFSFYQGLLCSSNESAPLLEFLCSFWKLSVGRGKWLCPPKKNKRRSLMEERTTNAEDPRPTATPRNSSPPLLAPSSAACRQLDPPKLPIRLEFLKGRIPAEGLQQVFLLSSQRTIRSPPSSKLLIPFPAPCLACKVSIKNFGAKTMHAFRALAVCIVTNLTLLARC